MLARVWRDYLIPLFKQLTFLPSMKHDPEIPDEAVTPEYMADRAHLWVRGQGQTKQGLKASVDPGEPEV
jgi:hypothetical protein